MRLERRAGQNCPVANCTRLASATEHGMCHLHQRRSSQGLPLTPSVQSRAMSTVRCRVLGCEQPSRARGFCKPHHVVALDAGLAAITEMVPEARRERSRTESRRRYHAAGERSRRYRRERTAAIRAERLPMISDIKLSRGCLDCGYNAHPAALHFDHRDPTDKSFEIAKSLTYSLARLMAEIAKCDVRCANCHAVRTVREGHGGRPRVDSALAAAVGDSVSVIEEPLVSGSDSILKVDD